MDLEKKDKLNKLFLFAIVIIAFVVVIGVYAISSSMTGAIVRQGEEYEEVEYYCCGSSQTENECGGANWNLNETCSKDTIGGRQYYNILASCCINIQSCEQFCISRGYEESRFVVSTGENDPPTYCKCSGYV